MVLRLPDKKSILPRLYRDSVVHVEEISLIEEGYLWRNAQVYVKESNSMEEFLILHPPSFYWSGKSLSAYMSAQRQLTVEEFAGVLERRRSYRMHLETSVKPGYVKRFMPWLTESYTVRYFRANASTFKPSCQHRANAVQLTPKNVKRLDPSASPSFIKRLRTASVYGYVNEKGELVATSGVGWLTKKSFGVSYTETKPEYRGRGIAKCLTSLASESLIRKGLIGVYAADVTNPASMAVAEGLGFQPHRDLKCYFN
ncbi:MAG TPA: GNAT family N-acetyltransferase [Candidatus Bathyarchaeia archaeon]|nr:GNAT family N-acetyltransferase [Candidatus Bathyarchaeia archaeon]